eukprot:CAMPEP_0119019922 /NCGR_PEP_ID=MMETSP1176-20130426/22976_1 /TAXON_ID=265551 /ORGANISM="Synedropsis recta cf, Strain CCMP1620" /LENGTH=43 /DNA_ID= /DNA_START= /DNA_END= /DNA_ORIENTATION=
MRDNDALFLEVTRSGISDTPRESPENSSSVDKTLIKVFVPTDD